MKSSVTILLCVAACTASPAHAQDIVVGLITKTDTNPFFVKMKEGAMEADHRRKPVPGSRDPQARSHGVAAAPA